LIFSFNLSSFYFLSNSGNGRHNEEFQNEGMVENGGGDQILYQSITEYQNVAGSAMQCMTNNNNNNSQSKLNFDNNFAKDTPNDKRKYFAKENNFTSNNSNINNNYNNSNNNASLTKALNYSCEENSNAAIESSVKSRVGATGDFVETQFSKAKASAVTKLLLSRQNSASSINQSDSFKAIKNTINSNRATRVQEREKSTGPVVSESLFGKRSSSYTNTTARNNGFRGDTR
jgi:hypothetical protein